MTNSNYYQKKIIMERLSLLVFVLIGLFFVVNIMIYLVRFCAAYKKKQMVEKVKEEEAKFIPAEYYSAALADACITDDYRFDNRREIFVQAASNPGELGVLWSKLISIDFNDHPNKLSHEMEEWFKQNVDNFYKYGECMAFIEHYPLLEDMFINNLNLPDQNVELQKRLISVCIAGQWRVNYINLLVKYLCKWDFQPELKAVVLCDYRFERVKNIYDLYRPASKR